MEDEAQRMIRSAVEAENLGADLLELRLDSIRYLTPDSIRYLFSSSAHVTIPKIASIMPTTIFGKYGGSDDSRRELLIAAADFADYVDLGSEMAPDILQRCLYE
ncbi:MAG: type I 3-dehydroquinate dehydratase, partial [Candidatus Methanomethylicus sp.]|nr:type I 3-dehydroquinate dehydratase [Candidatus Methanomethylicus sp.]